MRFIKLRRLRVYFVCLVLVIALRVANLSALETTKISGKITAKYTIQDSVIVGDNIGHVLLLSISEGKNVNTSEHAFMDGAQIVNISSADLIQGCGAHRGYIKFAKNSDTIYGNWEGMVTPEQTIDGAPTTSFQGIFAYTKGTGRFENIKGKGVYFGEFISKTEYFVEWRGTYIDLWKKLENGIGDQFGIDSDQMTFLWKKLRTVISDELGIDYDQITLEKSFVEDFCIDSLEAIELVMALEDKFNLEIPDDAAEGMNTVKDVFEYLLRKTGD